MIPALLLVLLAGQSISVPPSGWHTIDIPVRQHGVTLDIGFQVRHGSRVQVLLLDRDQLRRFERGRSIDPLFTTGFQTTGRLRYRIPEPGDYVLLIDNRLEGRGPTLVDLRIDAVVATIVHPWELPPARRRAVVTLSLLFFGATVFFSARQLLKHS